MNISYRVAHADDSEEVRKMRNACREYMTSLQTVLSAEDQANWWPERSNLGYTVWMVLADNKPVGFCMIRTDVSHGSTGTVGLYPEYRGKGIGTHAYRFMMLQAPSLRIIILNSNARSMRSAQKAGFQITMTDDRVTELIGT